MMSNALYRLGRFAARRPWAVIGSWLVLSVLVVGAAATVGQQLEDSFGAPGLDSHEATELLAGTAAGAGGLTAQVVLTPHDTTATFLDSTELQAELAAIQEDVRELPHVITTSDPAAAAADPVTGGSISEDGRVALLRVQYPVLDDLTPIDLANLEELVIEAQEDSPLRIEMGGDLFFAFEEPATGLGEALGLAAAVLILLVAFGSLIATGLPIGLALFGLGLGVSSLSLMTYLIEVPSWAPVIGSMVGIGVGIDYALFVVTRHREHLASGLTVEESVGRAVATAGLSVVFAGGTVVIAILGLAVAGIPFITAGGIAVSLIVLIMVAASITLLPAFLGLAGTWINRLTIRPRRHATGMTPALGWYRWGAHVSRHAAAYAVGATVVLLALAAPVVDLRVGTPDDGSLPEHRTQRQAYDLVAEGFGPGANGPLVVAVDISQDPGVLSPLRDAIRSDAGIASVTPPMIDRAAGVATLIAIPTTGPQNDATPFTVERLRAEVFPSVLGDSPARAHVGGQTATFADVGGKVGDRLPWFVGAVILLSVLLLTVVFRSIVVPLKAAAMNLLSIGASFGVMVMVFQWGWAADLIGLETTLPILPFIPMFMFAILFGLSMDYEVFLLSRIREEHLLTGDTTASVIHGIASTGRVITSAALIMVSVFGGFVLGDDPTTKMFGLGLAVAIFLDATVVRMVLVPAVMKLMGEANWWLPAWLDRLLPSPTVAGAIASAPIKEPATAS
jgi:RND superfamily putative drug exporter